MRVRVLPLAAEDQGAVDELCRRQNRRDGTSYAPPRLVRGVYEDGETRLEPNPNVVMGLKFIRDGRIVQTHIFERSLELTTFGGDPRATAVGIARELPAAMWLLERQGYEGFHARIGRGFLGQWERSLVDRLRMQPDDERLVHFYRPFRETQ